MLVIAVEVWPFGIESAKKSVGHAIIVNDGTGTRESGHYDVALYEPGQATPQYTARVSGFPRREAGMWALVLAALIAALDSGTCDI